MTPKRASTKAIQTATDLSLVALAVPFICAFLRTRFPETVTPEVESTGTALAMALAAVVSRLARHWMARR
jgi:hypothetical protein